MKKKERKNCKNCNSLVKRASDFYCNNVCQQIYQRREFIRKWKSGEISGANKVTFNLSDHIRNYLFEKHNSKCTECGWSKVNKNTGKIPLEVEHIDGNYRNNKEENLTLLCPNCHSLTSTYKGANKGNNHSRDRTKYKSRY